MTPPDRHAGTRSMPEIPSSPTHPTAFVLNIATSGLSAMRSLGRAGLPVVGVDPDPSHAGFASRYGVAVRSPHPVREPELLVEFLLEMGSRLEQPGILSPASDGTVLFVSRHREDLAESFRFILPPSEVMEAAVDKRRLYELCGRHGVATADTYYPITMDDVHAIKDDVQYPAFIKPYYSHLWQEHFPGGKGFKVFNADQLVAQYERIFPTAVEAMVQSIIQGPASNVRTVYMYLDQGGKLLGHVTTRKVRQFPVEFGRGSMAETFHDEAFGRMGLDFFRSIGYAGFGTIEFKKDDRDGVWKATDLNPRWVGPLELPTKAGVDFPLLHYRDLAGERPEPQLVFRDGVRWLNGVNDLASSWWHYRNGLLTPGEWIRSYGGIRAHATFAPDDPGPFLKEYQYGKKLVRVPLNLWRQR